ncbi:leucine-rich repeat domain-containing protein [Allobaculum stercoricanis]|uniref:leucine-rich repeat domain-containing protein n=1 Tax=Allobaculum stercoricanis TaxID=174709 RepID=UPI00248EBB2B|nr:leucine-rich repeat domain-containing protein [Allobaculum stercoricanis]
MDRKTRREKERLKKGAIMKSRMNKLMSLCLVAMMGTTLIPQPIQAEEVSEFEEELFEEATVEFEEGTFEEESNQVAESSSKTPVLDTFDDGELRYQVTGADTVEVIGFVQDREYVESLTIPSTVEYDNQTYYITNIGQSAFEGCKRLEEVSFDRLDNKIETIGKSAFKYCSSLRDISFYSFDNIKTIEESAFEGCREISSIDFPTSLETIGNSAFKDCGSLNELSFHYSLSSLKTIGDSAFKGCPLGNRVNFPKGLETIGNSAFEGCWDLKEIQFSDSLKIIGNSAFAACTRLERIYEWPKNLKTIGESAFKQCWQLSYVHLPEGLETIKRSAFEHCIRLTDVNLSKGLKTIEESAFKDCNRLGYIYLPEGLETIGESAFDLLPNEFYDPCLSRINIPSTVKELNHIFGKNSDDHTVTSPFKENSALFFYGDELPIIDSDFFNLLSSGKNKPIIYFPEDAMETYAGEKSPFVEAGLINPKLFDSYYEFIQLCPKNGLNDSVDIPRLDPISFMLDLDYDRNILDCSTNYPFSISSKGITGETILSYKVSVMAEDEQKKLISEASKIKFKVAHRYVWVVDKEPTKDEPGSKYQYCVKCEDAKAPVTIPPTGGGSGGGSTGGGSGGSSSGNTGGSGGSTSKPTNPNAPTQQVENAVYRAYNPYNGEHLYTTNYGEFKVITKNGWNDEGIAFMSESKEKGQAVYRVYNPNSGLHHYTTDVNEKNALVSLGWNDEGVAFYTSKNPKDTPVYRVYNENDGNHHYTMNANEALALISMGWKNEGIAFLTAPMK